MQRSSLPASTTTDAATADAPVRWVEAGALAMAGLVLWRLCDPSGEFPILDDWSYARSARHLADTGVLRYDGWNAPTLFLQVVYGAAVSWLSGFSFETLRLSVAVLGVMGAVGTLFLLTEVGASRTAAWVGSLTLLLMPSYVQHAFTFMTDVPFTALVVWSALFYVRALRTGAAASVVAGTVLAVCATLVRQPGVMLPLAFCAAWLAFTPRSEWSLRSLTMAIGPVVVVVAVYLLYQAILRHHHMEPALLGSFERTLRKQVSEQGVLGAAVWPSKRLFTLMSALALLLLPLTVCRLGAVSWAGGRPARLVVAALLGVAGLMGVMLIVHWPFRVLEPIPLVMLGQAQWGAAEEHHRFRPLVDALQAVSVALFVMVAAVPWVCRLAGTTTWQRRTLLFAWMSAGLMLVPFLFGNVYERYLLPVVPVAMMALCVTGDAGRQSRRGGLALTGKAAVVVSMALLAGAGTIAILFTHDGMLWNRVRWQAVDHLVRERGVPPQAIDGGLAVSGWYLFPDQGPLRSRYVDTSAWKGRWWRNDAADHLIVISTPRRLDQLVARASPDDARALDLVWKQEFAGWLPGASGMVLVCRGQACRRVFDSPSKPESGATP